MDKKTKDQQTGTQQYKVRDKLAVSIIVLLPLLASVIVIISAVGYIYKLDWVGVIDLQTGKVKSFWDWMGLWIIPIMLAMGAYLLNQSAKASDYKLAQQQRDNERAIADQRAAIEQEIAKDNQRQITLEAYFDRMTELLFTNKLRESSEGDEVRSIARTRTLTVLRRVRREAQGTGTAISL